MPARCFHRVLSVAIASTWLVVGAATGVPSAKADECPDVEVIFARGTGSPPGIGWTGAAFVNSLRSRLGDQSVGVYAVDYPASVDFRNSAAAGAADATARVEYMAAHCPDTRLVLGGSSQGAGVIDLITLAPTPIAGYNPTPLPVEVADHVAAVVVFGNPLRDMAGGPLSALSPLYGGKTIDLCAAGNPFCSSGLDFSAHLSYARNGMADDAAAFAADRL